MLPLLPSEYLSMIEEVATALVVDSETGIIEYVTPELEKLFGYPVRNGFIGETVEVLLPEDFRKAHVGYRQKLHDKPENRAMGFQDRPLWGRRYDGSKFQVAVSLRYMRARGDLRTKVVVRIIDLDGLQAGQSSVSIH